jgi:hypothetical protein
MLNAFLIPFNQFRFMLCFTHQQIVDDRKKMEVLNSAMDFNSQQLKRYVNLIALILLFI